VLGLLALAELKAQVLEAAVKRQLLVFAREEVIRLAAVAELALVSPVKAIHLPSSRLVTAA